MHIFLQGTKCAFFKNVFFYIFVQGSLQSIAPRMSGWRVPGSPTLPPAPCLITALHGELQVRHRMLERVTCQGKAELSFWASLTLNSALKSCDWNRAIWKPRFSVTLGPTWKKSGFGNLSDCFDVELINQRCSVRSANLWDQKTRRCF